MIDVRRISTRDGLFSVPDKGELDTLNIVIINAAGIYKDLLQKYQNTDAKRGAVLTAHKTYVVQMMGVVGRVDFHSV